jgi:molybdopterin molybdotransferase
LELSGVSGISLEEAQELILAQVKVLQRPEELPLLEGLNRIAYDSLRAVLDQPPFDRSPLDGYALRHEDTLGASRENPAACKVVARLPAGGPLPRPLLPGEAARIATGAMIPPGADCVVAQEDTDEGDPDVLIYRELSSFENYCFTGENCRRGECLLERGERLTHGHVGALAGQGIVRVRVFSPLRVGVLATGDELAEGSLPAGKIYDANTPYISARILSLGMEPVPGYGRDDPAALADAFGALLESCDAVVTTGGVSVGTRDYIPEAVKRVGARVLFRKVRVKPGSSMLGAVKDGIPVLCLSGNPFAAATTFEVLARPLLEKMGGSASYRPRRQEGILRTPFAKASPTRRLVFARIEGTDVFIPQKNALFSFFIRSNCLLDVPENSPPLEWGRRVSVVLL